MNFKFFLCFVLILAPYAVLVGQSCDGYSAMAKGTKYQYTIYDKGDMGKIKSKIDYEVKSSSGNVATLHKLSTDSKGKEKSNVEFEVTCTGNGVVIDQKTMLSKEMAASITNPDVTTDVTGTNPEIPHQLNVGQSLPDSKIDIKISAGTVNMSSSADVHDRKVIGQETVTVPAGSFDCFIISDEAISTTLVTKKVTRKIWVAKGVGTVKQETYDKKGKLDSLELLTSFQKG